MLNEIASEILRKFKIMFYNPVSCQILHENVVNNNMSFVWVTAKWFVLN